MPVIKWNVCTIKYEDAALNSRAMVDIICQIVDEAIVDTEGVPRVRHAG